MNVLNYKLPFKHDDAVVAVVDSFYVPVSLVRRCLRAADSFFSGRIKSLVFTWKMLNQITLGVPVGKFSAFYAVRTKLDRGGGVRVCSCFWFLLRM